MVIVLILTSRPFFSEPTANEKSVKTPTLEARKLRSTNLKMTTSITLEKLSLSWGSSS